MGKEPKLPKNSNSILIGNVPPTRGPERRRGKLIVPVKPTSGSAKQEDTPKKGKVSSKTGKK